MIFRNPNEFILLHTDQGFFPSSMGKAVGRISQLEFAAIPCDHGYPAVAVTHRVWTSADEAHESRQQLSAQDLWDYSFRNMPVYSKDPLGYLDATVTGQRHEITPRMEAYEQDGCNRIWRAWALAVEPRVENGIPQLNGNDWETIMAVPFYQKEFDYFFQLFGHTEATHNSLSSLSAVFTDIRGYLEIPMTRRGLPQGSFQGPMIVNFSLRDLIRAFAGPYRRVRMDCPDPEYIVPIGQR